MQKLKHSWKVMKMSNEEIEVTPVVIEPLEISYTPAVLSDNLDKIQAEVEKMVAPYLNVVVDPNDYETIKEARACLADLNKMKALIKGEFKRIKDAYTAPLNALKSRVDGIEEVIEDARSNIKRQVDEADAAFKASRRATLEEEYEGCSGAIADVIPFAAILEDKWLNRSTNEVKALNEVADKTAKALHDYETLRKQKLDHPDEVVKKFAETLDFGKALEYENELRAKDEEMKAFKEAQKAAEAVKEERTAPITVPVPQPVPEFVWELHMEFTGTKDYAQDVARVLKKIGITGASIKCKEAVHD